MSQFTVVLLSALCVALPAHADEAHRAPAAPAQAGSALNDAVVRKVDKDAQKITLKHGPLANLDMPAMTMVFHVADPAMLDLVKAGDKVQFRAEKIGGYLTVTQIERASER